MEKECKANVQGGEVIDSGGISGEQNNDTDGDLSFENKLKIQLIMAKKADVSGGEHGDDVGGDGSLTKELNKKASKVDFGQNVVRNIGIHDNILFPTLQASHKSTRKGDVLHGKSEFVNSRLNAHRIKAKVAGGDIHGINAKMVGGDLHGSNACDVAPDLYTSPLHDQGLKMHSSYVRAIRASPSSPKEVRHFSMANLE